MATLCNKKVTRTRTISNATGYSMYTWKASPTEAPASVAAPCHPCQSSSMMISFRHRSIQFYDDFARMMRLLWRTIFRHKFIIKLKLWWIWLLQWWELIVIEVDISSSGTTTSDPPRPNTSGPKFSLVPLWCWPDTRSSESDQKPTSVRSCLSAATVGHHLRVRSWSAASVWSLDKP